MVFVKNRNSQLLTSLLAFNNLLNIWTYLSNMSHGMRFPTCAMCDQQASDQPAHTRSLIRAFASRLNIL